MNNMEYSSPSYNTPCLIHIRGLGWIEAELSLEEDTGDMYFPYSGANVIKYEVWYSQVSEKLYDLDDVDFWVYLHNLPT